MLNFLCLCLIFDLPYNFFFSILNSPVQGMDEVKNNQVITVRYRNPKYADDFIFPARKLSTAKEPPRVLKPSDLKKEDSRNYRPVIGFNRNMPRARLDSSGHRALGWVSPVPIHWFRHILKNNYKFCGPVYKILVSPNKIQDASELLSAW